MPPMTHVLFLHEFMGMPCHTLSHSKFIFKKNIELEKVHLFHKLLYRIYLTSHMLIFCHLSLVNHFFFVLTFKKMRKIKFKRAYSIVDFPFFVGKKIAKFEKNMENISPHFPSASVAFATGCYSLRQHFNLMQL